MQLERRATVFPCLLLIIAVGLMASGAPSSATELSEQQMIQQLKSDKPRTRGLRNLQIESTAASQPSEAPSLSLLIQFDFDSARLRPQSEEPLRRLARAINSPELKGAHFAIEGHTDAKGEADYNLRLSERRAASVKAFLARQGVEPGRLYAVGKGASAPANRQDPFAEENRRVRVVNLR